MTCAQQIYIQLFTELLVLKAMVVFSSALAGIGYKHTIRSIGLAELIQNLKFKTTSLHPYVTEAVVDGEGGSCHS